MGELLAQGFSQKRQMSTAVGFDNRVHVMWTGMSGHALFYVWRGSSWSVPVQVEANGAYPHIRWSSHPLGISVVEMLDYVFLEGTKLEFGGLSLLN
jgi:hypothetical protein